MPEIHADAFRDLHSADVVQYVLQLDELPTEDEFVVRYMQLSKAKQKRKNGRKTYKWLSKYGLL